MTTRPVRVAFVIDNLSRAGTESQLVALLNALDRREVEPSLVLLDGTAESSRVLEPAGVPVLRLGITKLIGPAGFKAAAKLVRHWRDTRPDVVQAYFLDSTYLAAPAAWLAGVRPVVRVRNNLGYWLTRKHRLLNRAVAPLISVALTNSRAGAEALMASDCLPAARVRVLENGVDCERFAGFAPPFTRGPFRVGVVANLRPVKNIDGFLRAAKQVLAARPDAEFAVAGDGPERESLKALAQSLGIAGRVHFAGSVHDVPGFLATLDVAVMPSHSEGMSNAVLEFLAAGRAVVATEVGANRELIRDAGWLVPPGVDAALAAAILDCAADPIEARRRAAAGQQSVRERFGRAAMATRFTAFYRQLTRDRRGGGSDARAAQVTPPPLRGALHHGRVGRVAQRPVAQVRVEVVGQ